MQHFPLVVLYRRLDGVIRRWPIDIEAPDIVAACRRATRAAKSALDGHEIIGVIFDGQEHTS